MNIEIKNAIVVFRSNDEFFELEKSGKKPNTARELAYEELNHLDDITHIRIVSTNGQRKFEREITNISVVDASVIALHEKNRQLVIFSWKHEQP